MNGPWSPVLAGLKDKDVEAAIELNDDPCIVAGARGIGLIDHRAGADAE
jgi:hypothetical protein